MATFWTLTYDPGTGAVEKSFADWGLDEETAGMVTSNMAVDVFTVAMPGEKIDTVPVFPFEAQVTIRRNRTFTILTGLFSGGTIEFSGKRMLCVRDGRPQYEGMIYQFGGPWYDIEQSPYQQTIYWWVGPLATDLASALTSDVILFHAVGGLLGSLINSGQQITAILQHVLDQYSAAGMAAPYQIGTIDPALNLPTYQVRDLKCSEAIEICLKLSPDAVVYFDYTFAPPKVHVKSRGNLTAVNVAFADGVQHEALRLTPRDDLVPRSVVLIWRFTNVLDGATLVERNVQKYPLGGPDGGLRVIVQTIDLAGWSASTVKGRLEVSPIANTLGFWQKYIPELKSGKIGSFSVGAMSAVDVGDNPVDLTGLNVLDDGSNIASWMTISGTPVTGTPVTIKAVASWIQSDDQSRAVQSFPQKTLLARVTVTNGSTGNYSADSTAIAGEVQPTGLAQAVYTSLATLQYEGEISLAQTEISGVPGMGNTINITGGASAWTTMAAMVQRVQKQYGSGRTRISVGTARHLNAGDLTQLFLFNRARRVFVNPSVQVDAKLATASNVQLGVRTAKENTQTGLEERKLLVISNPVGSDATMVKHDAVGGQMVVGKFDATNTPISGQSLITIKMADIADAATPDASFQWFSWKDADTCVLKKAKFLMTAPEDA